MKNYDVRSVRVPITISSSDLELEERGQRKERARQCPSILAGSRGLITFCSRRQGHEGDHRGTRAQWLEESLPLEAER